MKKIAFSALLAAMSIQGAMAAGDGVYIGGGLGMGVAVLQNSSTGVQSTYTSSASRFLGGYQISRNFAIEAELVNLGTFSDSSGSVDATGSQVSGVGMIPLGSGQISLLFKAGLSSVKTTASAKPGFVLVGPATQTKSGVGVGFGVNYDVTPNFSMRLTIDSYPYGISNDIVSGRLGMYGLSGVFHF